MAGTRRTVLACLALVTCGCLTGCTQVSSGQGPRLPTPKISRQSAGPRQSTVPQPGQTSASRPMPARVYRIMTDGPGFLVTTTVAGSRAQTRVTGQVWIKTFRLAPGISAEISATADSTARFIQCTVTVDGTVRIVTRAGGPDAAIRCS